MNLAEGDNDRAGNLIWIDLEMTGLNTESDTIIEIATIITDRHLNELAEGPELAIGQPSAVMDAMDDWNTRQHGASGLTERVLNSDVTLRQAELATLDFLSNWVDAGISPMAGNSICQDRRFLARESRSSGRLPLRPVSRRNPGIGHSRIFAIRLRSCSGIVPNCWTRTG